MKREPIPGLILLFTLLVISWLPPALAQQPDKQIVPGISSSKYIEFSPTISADGRTIIFESSTDMDKGWELFESRLDDTGNWSVPVPLQNINEKCAFLAGPSISYDGNRLFYTAFIEGVTQDEDIFYSNRTGENTWSEPISVGAPVNTIDNYEGFPSISADGNSLYFIRLNLERGYDRKSKENCFNIFVSQKISDDQWGEPVMLPSPINTGCERDPKIMADNHTLIFSSVREDGKGKYDMYQTFKQADGSWTPPVPLDFVNSDDNDQSPCISASGEHMFYYSKNDIYTVPIPTQFRQLINVVIQGRILDDKKLLPLPGSIIITNLTTGTDFTTKNNEVDGEFSLILTTGSKYRAVFNNESFFPDTVEFDLQNQKKYELIRRNVVLRSSWQVAVSAVDKDLGKPINAWVTIERKGTAIYGDSLVTTRLAFDAPNDYDLTYGRQKYTPGRQTWGFKERRLSKDKNVSLKLEHQKSKFVTTVKSIITKQDVKIKVSYHNKDEDQLIIADAGELVMLRTGDRYEVITGSEEGYFFSTANITAGLDEAIEMFIVPIEVNGRLTLNNITFETNSAELRNSSRFDLDQVVELMRLNPGLSIEISAHTDDVGDENFNLKLSEKRASSAMEYLKQKNVSHHRLTPKGYGEAKPAFANDTDEHRALNRRVELRVLKIR